MRNFHLPGRSGVFTSTAMAATSHPIASKVALDLLSKGGNAMDAAIGAAVVQGIAEPQMTGIGGDAFVLYTPAGSQQVKALNGSGRAPAGFGADALRAQGHTSIPIFHNAAAVTIPGAVDAFCKLNAEVGRLPLSDVLAPAIHYAEAGIPVAPRVASDWANAVGNLHESARSRYLINGAAPRIGQNFACPDQAKALRLIAENGRAGFYEGAVAQDMVDTLQTLGGVHTLDDFESVTSTTDDPITSTYGAFDVYEHPPNGQGIIAQLLLNILKNFDLSKLDPFGIERTHIEAEAAKLAYDTRDRFLADQTPKIDHILSQGTADALANLIDPKRALDLSTGLTGAVHKDTICLTVVDKDRMVVSLIYSIFKTFGSGIASDKYGILLHNRGAGFNLTKGHLNEATPGKRPMHTIIPAIAAERGQITLPFCVMGGQYQANGHARFLTNISDFGMDLQSAIDGPRSFPQFGKLELEDGYSDHVKAGLADKGHVIAQPETAMGGAQAIRIHANGTLEGGSDPRKDGFAMGY